MKRTHPAVYTYIYSKQSHQLYWWMEITSGNSSTDQLLIFFARVKIILIFSATLAKRGDLNLDLNLDLHLANCRRFRDFCLYVLNRVSSTIFRFFSTTTYLSLCKYLEPKGIHYLLLVSADWCAKLASSSYMLPFLPTRKTQ